ncbi:MAG: MCE family protein [Prevotella sp.]|nr:MCE family protein [Prevotella sp.]
MKFFTKEVQIALVAIVGLVVLFFGMNFLKGLSMLSAGNKYMAQFSDVTGLSASSPVYCNGVKVGTVESINYDYNRPDHIVATLGLDADMQLPQGTCAEIASDLLGNVRLELRLGDMTASRLAVGDTIMGAQQAGVMGKAANMVPQIEKMLPKLDSILASVNALLADPTIGHSLHNIEDITAGLTTTAAGLNQLTASLNHQLPVLMSKATGVMANADTLTRTLNEMNLAATMAKVDRTLQNVEQMTARLDSKEGTVGLLLRDAELYNNLNATMAHADSLMIDFKAHPKRYIHFSVFGKKDK